MPCALIHYSGGMEYQNEQPDLRHELQHQFSLIQLLEFQGLDA